jgi:hypothetical protein
MDMNMTGRVESGELARYFAPMTRRIGYGALGFALSGLMALACAGAPRRPAFATNDNVRARRDNQGADQVVFLDNSSSEAIVVTSVVLYGCSNTLTPCDSTAPNIEIGPGQTRIIARVQPSAPKARVRFGYRYKWVGRNPRRAPVPEIRVGMPGVESAALLERVSGTIVLAKPLAALELVSLPDKRSREIQRERWQAMSASGPDSAGNIALGTDTTEWKEHAIRLLHPDGREEVLARRPGGILWHNAISAVALAPVGGRISFASKTGENLNDYQPLGIGVLEMWDPTTRSIRRLSGKATGFSAPSWFPDGRRLAFTEPDSSGVRIVVLDVTTGARLTTIRGDFPMVSTDGRTMLVRQLNGIVLVDVSTGASKPVTIPGNVRPPIAFIDSRYVVYQALPTEGMPTAQTTNNSPLVGAKSMLAVKLIDLERGEMVTLVDLVDPRLPVSASVRVR